MKTRIAVALLSLVLISCVTSKVDYENKYYTTLDMYYQTMFEINKAYSEGQIPVETYTEIISRANQFVEVMKIAHAALQAKEYEKVDTQLGIANAYLIKIAEAR